jgi:hypothetical protein
MYFETFVSGDLFYWYMGMHITTLLLSQSKFYSGESGSSDIVTFLVMKLFCTPEIAK